MFTWSDSTTDSERFYNSILELFKDPDEQEKVNDLLTWWNRLVFFKVSSGHQLIEFLHIIGRQVFLSYSSAQHPVTKDSALAKIREKRAALKARNSGGHV